MTSLCESVDESNVLSDDAFALAVKLKKRVGSNKKGIGLGTQKLVDIWFVKEQPIAALQ